MRNVDIPHLEPGPLSVEATGPESTEPTFVGQHRERVGLVDDLGQFAATEEVLDRRRDTLGIDQCPRCHLLDILQAHSLLHRSTQLQESLADLLGRQLVDCPQPPVAEIVDVVGLDQVVATGLQEHQVTNRVDEVLRTQRHRGVRNAVLFEVVFEKLVVLGGLLVVRLELAVDAKTADLAEPVPVDVKELLAEQVLGLFQLGRVARPQPLVDPQQRFLVAVGLVVVKRVEDQAFADGIPGNDLDVLDLRRNDLLGTFLPDQHDLGVVPDRVPRIDNDLPASLVAGRIDNVIGSKRLGNPFDIFRLGSLDQLGRVEQLQQGGVGAVLGPHRTQQRQRRELAALVDADIEHILLVDNQFDPTASFGDHAAGKTRSFARLGGLDKIHARRTVQLADHDAFGTVDDKLATAEHDRHVTEIDFLLDRLLLVEPHLDAERLSVCQPQLAAGRRVETRFQQLVAAVIQTVLTVVTLDREHFLQDPLQPERFPLVRLEFLLQEAVVGLGLDLGEILQQVTIITALAEVLGVVGLQNPGRGNRHVRLSFSCSLRPLGLGSRTSQTTGARRGDRLGTGQKFGRETPRSPGSGTHANGNLRVVGFRTRGPLGQTRSGPSPSP